MRGQHSQSNASWSPLCHACAAPVAPGAQSCPACGATLPTAHEELRLKNHPLILEFNRNRRLVITFALSLAGVLLLVSLVRFVYDWRRNTTPSTTEWMLNEGYYWMIAIVLLSIGSHVAIHLINRRLEKKWRHAENAPRSANHASNQPYTTLMIGVSIVLFAGFFMAILIIETTTLEHSRATRELLPAIVASGFAVVVGVALIVIAFRQYRAYRPLTGGRTTNLDETE